MYLPLGTFSPNIKIGLVSASRDCFPRVLSETRTNRLLESCKGLGANVHSPEGDCAIIETREHAREAAKQLRDTGCDAAVLYLGNFSPEIEDAFFVKEFGGNVMIIAAAEESGSTLSEGRGDALCGMMSAIMAVRKRDLLSRVYIPERPVVNAEQGAASVAHFIRVMKAVKGTRNATIGLFGPRPRDFETCNYNIASVASIGVEVEEFGHFDLSNEVERIKEEEDTSAIETSMNQEISNIPKDGFAKRLSSYEKALLNFRDNLKLSGMASQCWTEQETKLKHVPCFINGRLAGQGFPVACENDAYSLIAELMGQYASDASVAILDINHSIPADLDVTLDKLPNEDLVGMFHCGNTDTRRMKNAEMKYQFIMNRLMEPEGEPDITRGTIEGQISASPITMLQVHGVGDKMCAYIAEGEFLDLDPKTFGSTGTAYIPGFSRFYRHVLLGAFHHHAAVAFEQCGAVLYDAFKLLGIETIYTPNPGHIAYPGENTFFTGRVPQRGHAKSHTA